MNLMTILLTFSFAAFDIIKNFSVLLWEVYVQSGMMQFKFRFVSVDTLDTV